MVVGTRERGPVHVPGADPAVILTVIVPTMPGRESLLSRCLWSITSQGHHDDIEVLVVDGNGPLGDKVNAAVVEAQGGYVTVVDDDDWLAGGYLDAVLPACDVDYVGFQIIELCDGRYSATCRTSGVSKTWEGPFRWPVPKGVTRTVIARQVEFGNEYTADRAWSAEVAAAVDTHRYIDRGLYIYDFHRSTSLYVGAGQPRDVGMWPWDPAPVHHLTVDRPSGGAP